MNPPDDLSDAGQKPEDGLFLNPAAWKDLQAQLSAPPSEALRRFMAAPASVSDELEQILTARRGLPLRRIDT